MGVACDCMHIFQWIQQSLVPMVFLHQCNYSYHILGNGKHKTSFLENLLGEYDDHLESVYFSAFEHLNENLGEKVEKMKELYLASVPNPHKIPLSIPSGSSKSTNWKDKIEN